MYFDLDDRFYDGKPVIVRVVYFDSGDGSFTLRYDAAGAPAKTALAVTKGNSGRWKEASARLPDARFRNGCPHATDLVLATLWKCGASAAVYRFTQMGELHAICPSSCSTRT